MIDRKKQIELMERSESRAVSYFRAWAERKPFRDALHRYDADQTDGTPRRVANHD